MENPYRVPAPRPSPRRRSPSAIAVVAVTVLGAGLFAALLVGTLVKLQADEDAEESAAARVREERDERARHANMELPYLPASATPGRLEELKRQLKEAEDKANAGRLQQREAGKATHPE